MVIYIVASKLQDDFVCTSCNHRLPKKGEREFAVYCSNSACGRGFHIDCHPGLKNCDPLKSDPTPLWACSVECGAALKLKAVSPGVQAGTSGNNLSLTSNTNSDHAKLEQRVRKIEKMMSDFPTNASIERKFSDLRDDLTNIIQAALANLVVPQPKHESLPGTKLTINLPQPTGGMSTTTTSSAEKSSEKDFASSRQQSVPEPTLQHATHKYRTSIAARVNTIQMNSASSAELARLNESRKYLAIPNIFKGDATDWLVFESEFYRHWDVGQFPAEDMMSKLRKWLQGDALDHVRGYLNGATTDPEIVMAQLRRHFFRPKAMLARCHKDILAQPRMKNGDRDAVVKMVQAVAAYINMHNQLGAVLSGPVDQEVEDLLSTDAMGEWQRHLNSSVDGYGNSSGDSWISFHKILEKHIESLAYSPHNFRNDRGRSSVNAINNKSSQDGRGFTTRRCIYDECEVGKIYSCASFINLTPTQRRKWVAERDLCMRCFRHKDHTADNCAGNIPHCRVKGCCYPKDHSSILHPPEF
jgi:hypothetical protein